MQTPGDRLRQTRIERGFKIPADSAKFFGWHPTTYNFHETGRRGIKPWVAKTYAAAFGISDAWLLTGKGEAEERVQTVKVVGYVGPGAEFLLSEADAIRQVVAPPGASPATVAAEIRGDSCLPIYEEGDLVFWSKPRTDIDALLNRTKPMLVELIDGRRLLKSVGRGSKLGSYSLLSPGAAVIDNVQVRCVILIDWVKSRS